MTTISKKNKNKYSNIINGKRLVLKYKKKECDICLENFNNTNKIQIKCEYCEMKACSACCIRYMSENDKIQCMNVSCNREWSYRFLINSFNTISLQKKIKEIYSNRLFNNEKIHFKTRMEYDNKLNILNLKLHKCNNEYNMNNEIYDTFKGYKLTHSGLEDENDLNKLSDMFQELNMKVNEIFENENENENEEKIKKFIHEFIDNINRDIIKKEENYLGFAYENVIKYEIYLYKSLKHISNTKNELENQLDELWDDIENGIKLPEVLSFKCPNYECMGMYNVNNFKCLVCNNDICSSCRELKDHEHKCNSNTVETLKLLNVDSKPCPKCYTVIHKIDGCDQMWCTSCHTAFSWRSGLIETKIHNPHYYEWLRTISEGGVIPRNDGDNQNGCGPEELQFISMEEYNYKVNVHYDQLYKIVFKELEIDNSSDELLKMIDKINIDLSERIYICVFSILFMREKLLFAYGTENNNLNNFDVCINYLNKRITDHQYKKYLRKENKKILFNADVLELINLMIEMKIEIVNKFTKLLNTEINSLEQCIESIHIQLDLVNRLEFMNKYISPLVENIENLYKKKVCKHLKRILNQ